MYKAKSQTDDQFIITCLRNHFVFYNLSEAELNNVRDYMWWTEIPIGLLSCGWVTKALAFSSWLQEVLVFQSTQI